MTFLSHLLSTALAERIGWTLLHSLWQFALMALLLAGMLSVAATVGQPPLRRRLFALAAMMAAGVRTFCLLPATSPSRPAHHSPPKCCRPSPTGIPFRPPTIGRATDLPNRRSPPRRRMSMPAERPRPINARPSRFLQSARRCPVAAVDHLWFVGVVLFSLRNLGGWFGVQRLRRLGTAPVRQELANRVKTLAERMKISRPVHVLQSTWSRFRWWPAG